jgi:hypothetical protein
VILFTEQNTDLMGKEILQFKCYKEFNVSFLRCLGAPLKASIFIIQL